MEKILIVEDEPIIAKDIEICLLNLGFGIAGVANDSESALDILNNRAVDFVILDINIDGTKDGIQVAEVINEKYHIPFIFLTSYSDVSTLTRAKKVTPYGYIVKPFDERDLKTSMTIALYNHKEKAAADMLSKEKIDKLALTPLSEKEYAVVTELTQGLSTSHIAEKHFVSVNTVKFHLRNIYKKLDVPGKPELLAKVMQ